jgi:sugar (pentulose or hexulose) kinase
MDKDLVVGIDSSTSATKAIAWRPDGALVAEGRAPIALANPQLGYFEQAAEDWWRSTCSALKTLTAKIDPARIAGIAISNQRETFSIFTESGEALRPGMVWLDDRARAQERRFGATFGAERIHAISGKPLDVIPCLYRVIWLQEHQPELLDRATRIAEVHGYLVFRLTGRWVTSTASADPTGMIDMTRLDWSSDILSAAGIPREKLLDLVAPGGFIGEVTETAAAATGLAIGTPVFAGGGDGQCAGTGVAALQPGRAYINLGTAVVAGTYSAKYGYDPAFRTEIAIADSGYIFETCVRSGTFLLDWLASELFGIEPARKAEALARLEGEAAACPVGAGGVVLLPYWQGCMTPHWDSAARGIIAGLSGSTKKGDIYRAILEGIALDQGHAAARAASVIGTPVEQYVAIGGGAASDLWLQILADATNRPISRSNANEASSLGAAMAAAKGAGWFPSLAEASVTMASPIARTFEPDPKNAALYAELLEIYNDLWPTLSSWNRRLVDFVERRAG